METTELTVGAAADRIQDLQITNGKNVPETAESVASKDLNATTPKVDDIDANRNPSADPGTNSVSNHTTYTNGSHAITTGNDMTEPTTNDHVVPGFIDNDAQQAKPQSFVHGEASTSDAPDIKINGEPEAEHVNKDIMGPEDEEDGETRISQNCGNTNVGQKKKTKKKSKSKRGLVSAPLLLLPYNSADNRVKNAPTGFEEFYVDTPLTPVEHEEEKGLYHK